MVDAQGTQIGWKKGKQLTIIHKNILQLARLLREKKRNFNMVSLFETCSKKLPNPEPEIYQAILDLYNMKYIVEGKTLFKQDILTNEKRSTIYE